MAARPRLPRRRMSAPRWLGVEMVPADRRNQRLRKTRNSTAHVPTQTRWLFFVGSRWASRGGFAFSSASLTSPYCLSCSAWAFSSVGCTGLAISKLEGRSGALDLVLHVGPYLRHQLRRGLEAVFTGVLFRVAHQFVFVAPLDDVIAVARGVHLVALDD